MLIGPPIAAYVAQDTQMVVVPVTILKQSSDDTPKRLDLTLYGVDVPTTGGVWFFYVAAPGRTAVSKATTLGLFATEVGLSGNEPLKFTLYPRPDVMALFLKLKHPAIRIVGGRAPALTPDRVTAVLR